MRPDSDVMPEDARMHSVIPSCWLMKVHVKISQLFKILIEKSSLLLLHSEVKGQVGAQRGSCRAVRDSASCSGALQQGEVLLTRGLEPGSCGRRTVSVLPRHVRCVR